MQAIYSPVTATFESGIHPWQRQSTVPVHMCLKSCSFHALKVCNVSFKSLIRSVWSTFTSVLFIFSPFHVVQTNRTNKAALIFAVAAVQSRHHLLESACLQVEVWTGTCTKGRHKVWIGLQQLHNVNDEVNCGVVPYSGSTYLQYIFVCACCLRHKSTSQAEWVDLVPR